MPSLPPLLLLLLALAGLSGPGAAPAMAQGRERVLEEGFFEPFDGPGLLRRRWMASDGWTNGPHQDCHWSRRAVELRDGMLHLMHRPREDGPPICGEIQSRAFIRYGTIEARIRTPRASGLNASVFTYAGPVHKSPHDEIDIEILTRDPGGAFLNTYVAGTEMHGTTVPVDPPLDEGFRTVAMEWRPDGITWFLDGREVHRTPEGAPLPDNPQKIYMSFWSTTTLTDWMGAQEPREGDLSYQVDWIAYTPPGQSCLFAESITC